MSNNYKFSFTMEDKKIKEERFEFAVMMNDILICRRYFKVYNFIEGSMETVDFKETVDQIVKMLDDDLKSKSRVYTWFMFDKDDGALESEFNQPLLEPWECTFKFIVYDRKREVFSKIWDGYAYPRSVRQKIDFTNKFVKYIKDGQMFTYDKESYFEAHKGRLHWETELLRAQIWDKEDVLAKITKLICKVCSPMKEDMKNGYRITEANNDEYLSDLTTEEKIGDSAYKLPLRLANKKVEADWAKLTEKKTKAYFKDLF